MPSSVRYFELNLFQAGIGGEHLVLHRQALPEQRSLDLGLLADRLCKLIQHLNASFQVFLLDLDELRGYPRVSLAKRLRERLLLAGICEVELPCLSRAVSSSRPTRATN